MIVGLLWLLSCWWLGEGIVALTGLPLPGAVVGMALLFAVLQVRSPRADSGLWQVSDGLMRHLQLLFVPAGVGIVVWAGAVRADALPVLVALLGSWLLGLLTVAWVLQVLGRSHA